MHRVVVLTFAGAQALDVVGPVEVLQQAGGYAVELVAPGGGLVRWSNGLEVVARDLPPAAPLDTLLVCGGEGTRAAATDPDVLAWTAATAAKARRVTGVCTGAFVLAAAGLLDGRPATTHWAWCDLFARSYPSVEVRPDALWVRDGKVWTSAGVTAGMDLALALVEADHGPGRALAVARELVLFLKRPGGQAQFSAALSAQAAAVPPLRALQEWLPDHLTDDLSLPRIARRAGMPERSFTRAFRREIGQTPAAYIETLRVERARQLLEAGDPPLEQVALAVGLGSAEVLRRVFHRRLGVPPSAYRQRFQEV